jgi:hypothetical protein
VAVASRLPLLRLALFVGRTAWAKKTVDASADRERRSPLPSRPRPQARADPQDASFASLRMATIASLVAPAAAAAASLAVCFMTPVRSPLSVS